ncbi:MAG: hypothetical protein DWQ41_24460, partial [Planctomycetota bacterium]
NIVLRERLAISVEADATRGVPVIHANFLGYDENAHRRGPGTNLAHAVLPGIDRALRRIWNAAHASRRRHYHVWFLSDHGQETTLPYKLETGHSVETAVQNTFDRLWAEANADRRPQTVAVGPVGYVYWPRELTDEEKCRIAPVLQSECRIPLVMVRQSEGVVAWTESGFYRMPEQAAEVLAENHPHLPEVADEFTALCGCIPHFAAGLGFAMLLGVRNRWDFRKLERTGGTGHG